MNRAPNKDMDPLEREVIRVARPERNRRMEKEEQLFSSEQGELDRILDYWDRGV
jgi:hypothetical protein